MVAGCVMHPFAADDGSNPGITQRCRLSWLTNSALVYEAKMQGDGRGVEGSQPMSTAAHRGAHINFGDLTPYLTYVLIVLRHGFGGGGGGWKADERNCSGDGGELTGLATYLQQVVIILK